jgi:8-oxo-dGTP diphosphatase
LQSRLDVVVGIVRDATDRILINQRRPGAHLEGLWEFPGGKRKAGEERETALKRELNEELGIEIVAAEPLLTLRHDYPDRLVHLDVWSVLEYVGEPRACESQVISWVRPEEMSHIDLLPADSPIVAVLLEKR